MAVVAREGGGVVVLMVLVMVVAVVVAALVVVAVATPYLCEHMYVYVRVCRCTRCVIGSYFYAPVF